MRTTLQTATIIAVLFCPTITLAANLEVNASPIAPQYEAGSTLTVRVQPTLNGIPLPPGEGWQMYLFVYGKDHIWLKSPEVRTEPVAITEPASLTLPSSPIGTYQVQITVFCAGKAYPCWKKTAKFTGMDGIVSSVDATSSADFQLISTSKSTVIQSTERPSKERNSMYATLPGDGEYDRMTYDRYRSVTELTPKTTLAFATIAPQVWYCNVHCSYSYTLKEGNKIIAHGSVDGNRTLLKTRMIVVLRPGKTYTLTQEVNTKASVGIITTGREKNQDTRMTIRTISAETDHKNYIDRGGIGFTLWPTGNR